MVLDYDKKLVRESDAARADGRLACGVGKWGRLSDVCQSRCPPRRLLPALLAAPSAAPSVTLPTAPALAIVFIVKYALI
mgnify:CR=1 FL=1